MKCFTIRTFSVVTCKMILLCDTRTIHMYIVVINLLMCMFISRSIRAKHFLIHEDGVVKLSGLRSMVSMIDGGSRVKVGEERLLFLYYARTTDCVLHHIVVCLTRANVWKSMGKPCSCTQFIQSRIFLLQVTRESVLSTTSHMRASERAMKSKVRMIKSLSP